MVTEIRNHWRESPRWLRDPAHHSVTFGPKAPHGYGALGALRRNLCPESMRWLRLFGERSGSRLSPPGERGYQFHRRHRVPGTPGGVRAVLRLRPLTLD